MTKTGMPRFCHFLKEALKLSFLVDIVFAVRIQKITPIKATVIKSLNECLGCCNVCCDRNVVNVAKAQEI
jgi:hypothetical protein